MEKEHLFLIAIVGVVAIAGLSVVFVGKPYSSTTNPYVTKGDIPSNINGLAVTVASLKSCADACNEHICSKCDAKTGERKAECWETCSSCLMNCIKENNPAQAIA